MTLSTNQLKVLCDRATAAAIEAGEYIQSQVDQNYNKKKKEGGHSLASQIVTAVDIQAQDIIIKGLKETIEQFDLGLLTEETPDDKSRLKKAYFWCIDPMDGTLPFTEGRTGYAVSIALVTQSGDPDIGVVYVPDLGECYSSIKGNGVTLNQKPFLRNERVDHHHLFLDRSLQSTEYYPDLKADLENWTADHNLKIVEEHSKYGAVRNALSVMNSGKGCYFKFPKKKKGGGSAWDFAATRLFFEELDFVVCNCSGEKLHLNNPETTFMNEAGVIYATEDKLAELIISLSKKFG